MKIKKHQAVDKDGNRIYDTYWFWCPGCDEAHMYVVGNKNGTSWTFNDDLEKPTFAPSLLYPSKPVKCHLHVRAGKIEYCGDCQHDLKGKTVDLPDLPDWLAK